MVTPGCVCPKGYKQVEVGVIPEELEILRLGDLLQSQRNVRYGIVQPGKFESNGCYMLRSQDYSKGWSGPDGMHKVTEQLERQYRNARIQKNDLVITVVGAGIGQVVVVPDWLDGAILSRSTARIAIDENKAARNFVRAFLECPLSKRQILDCQKEGAQPVVSCLDLANFIVIYPPLPEQKAIAEALSDADALIESLDRFIVKQREIKQGAMQELLTGKRRLPGFSGEWEVKRLGDVAKLYQPVTISANHFTESGYPVYGANGVIGYYRDFNHDSWQVTVTCRGSTCGTVNRTVEKCWITGNAMVIGCDQNIVINKEFLYYALANQDLSVCITGTGQP